MLTDTGQRTIGIGVLLLIAWLVYQIVIELRRVLVATESDGETSNGSEPKSSSPPKTPHILGRESA